MHYAGIDYHKRYSFVSIQNAAGEIKLEYKIPGNDPHVFSDMFAEVGDDVAVVYEASFN